MVAWRALAVVTVAACAGLAGCGSGGGARRIEERFLRSARDLEPPREDAEDWRRALALDERLLRKFQRLHDALKRGDIATVSAVMDELTALPRHNVYEQRLGIQGCTSGTARRR